MKIKSSIVTPVFLVVVALTLFMLSSHSCRRLPYMDNKADSYFSKAMTQAGVAYGVCRMVNASVSVIKGSQIQIEPAGLGVALAAGQVLDPLDDMTERASDILITAIVSLGIQKITYELCVEYAPVLIGISLLVFVVVSFFKGIRAKSLQTIMLKWIILIAVARFCLPISSMISSGLNDHYFSPKITEAKNGLAMNSPEIERLKDWHIPEVDGVMGSVKNGFKFVGKKTSDLWAARKMLTRNMGSMISNLLTLSYLYVALFIIQVILLPIGAFWLLVRIANALCGTNIPYI
ncbi:MAG: hypothetical protein WCS73_07020, partial [Lentisphaeria bacterium]